MRKYVLIIILSLLTNNVLTQISVSDTFQKILRSKSADSAKIDKINQCIFQYVSNNPEIALMYSDTAIQLSSRIQDSNRIALSFNRKGVALFYLGDYNGSLENYFLALSIKEKRGQKNDMWREYNNIGLVLRNLEQNEEALKYFKQALNLVEKTGNEPVEAIIWNNIGISLRGLKQYEEAKKVIEKALEINTRFGIKQAMAQDLNNLGNIYRDMINYTKAIEYYTKALEINRLFQNNYEKAQNLNNLAEVYLILKKYSRAKIYLDEAEDIINYTHADQLKLNNLTLFADYYVHIKNYQKAYYYKDKYSQIRDSIYNTSRIKQFNQLKTLANAENEIQKLGFLRKINLIQDEKIQKQRIIQAGTGFVIILLLFLVFFMFRNLKIKKKLNISLNKHADELSILNKDLKSANEELISQREEIERVLVNLQSAQNQLIHSEKMASLGILAAGVAHEINNPLNFIQGGIEGTETYLKENLAEHLHELGPLIAGMQIGVSRAAAIVKSLSHYSRQDNQKKMQCNIHEIIENCLIMLNNQIKNRIDIHKNYSSKPLIMNGNESQLHQVLLNILANAVQSIVQNGKIIISTTFAKESMIIKIEDNGCGINPENLSKIFDPFFTTKEPGKGTGLGLSIAYNILKEHNGTIDFQSLEGKGTKVEIRFPQE